VPSPLHDQIVALVRANPRVFVDLVGAAAALEVPEGALAVCASETFSTQVEDYRADAVIELRGGGGDVARVVVVEVQLRRDPRKVFALPVYQAVARARYRVACDVVVVAPAARVANALRRPIALGAGSVFQAIVVFDELPGERGALLLELVLSALPPNKRRAVEEYMQSNQYEYKSEYLRGLLERGRTEGREAGRQEGREAGREAGRAESR
jgi:hypothetical protein